MLEAFTLSYLALWGLVVFQSLVLVGLVHSVYLLQKAPSTVGIPPGSSDGDLIGQAAPAIGGVDLQGAAVDSVEFGGRLTALLFVSPTCRSCTVTLDELEALKSKVKGSVIIVCRAERHECLGLAEKYRSDVPVVVDKDLTVSKRFHVSTVPTAVVIDKDGRIQSYGHPMHAEELELMGDRTGG